MLFRNPDLDRAFTFIRDSEFDVFCLQEVPEAFIERLRTLPLNIASAIDIRRFEAGQTIQTYCIILTPHRIVSRGSIRFPLAERPLRTKLFHFVMWRLRRIDERGSLFADIELESDRVRMLCLHLTLSHPEQIEREFDIAIRESSSSMRTIVCGDLNILEKSHITVLNWLLGGKVEDVFALRRTRERFENKFRDLALKNPLRGRRTHTIARSQLDHILVPEMSRVIAVRALSDRIGSDHTPVFVELD